MMQSSSFISIIYLNYLLVEAQILSPAHRRVELAFRYVSNQSPSTINVSITARLVRKVDADATYVLQGNTMDDGMLIVTGVVCVDFLNSCRRCQLNFSSKYLSFQTLMSSSQYVLYIEKDNSSLIRILNEFAVQTLDRKITVNLTCIIPDILMTTFHKPRVPYDPTMSKTSLIGIIFLCTCVVLVFSLSIGWFVTIYYRRFAQNRMEKLHRKELEKITQQILDKSPIVIYEPSSEGSECIDKDPTCAICLETFKAKEKLRKLEVCSHYFHMACIDPWLLAHQSCPLCNRNIIHDTIPSISSMVLNADNASNNEGTASIAHYDNNRAIQT